MKNVFFESLRYKLITKNDFYYGSCPDIHITTPIPKKENQLLLLLREDIESWDSSTRDWKANGTTPG